LGIILRQKEKTILLRDAVALMISLGELHMVISWRVADIHRLRVRTPSSAGRSPLDQKSEQIQQNVRVCVPRKEDRDRLFCNAWLMKAGTTRPSCSRILGP